MRRPKSAHPTQHVHFSFFSIAWNNKIEVDTEDVTIKYVVSSHWRSSRDQEETVRKKIKFIFNKSNYLVKKIFQVEITKYLASWLNETHSQWGSTNIVLMISTVITLLQFGSKSPQH